MLSLQLSDDWDAMDDARRQKYVDKAAERMRQAEVQRLRVRMLVCDDGEGGDLSSLSEPETLI